MLTVTKMGYILIVTKMGYTLTVSKLLQCLGMVSTSWFLSVVLTCCERCEDGKTQLGFYLQNVFIAYLLLLC